MKVKQISVFIENKPGRLAEVTIIIYQASINIRSLFLADTKDFGILRMIVNLPDKAVEALKKEGFTVRETEVLAVEVPDKPGGLYEILTGLENNGISIEYMYAFAEKRQNSAIMIFRFDEIEKALDILSQSGVKVLTHEEVYNL